VRQRLCLTSVQYMPEHTHLTGCAARRRGSSGFEVASSMSN